MVNSQRNWTTSTILRFKNSLEFKTYSRKSLIPFLNNFDAIKRDTLRELFLTLCVCMCDNQFRMWESHRIDLCANQFLLCQLSVVLIHVQYLRQNEKISCLCAGGGNIDRSKGCWWFFRETEAALPGKQGDQGICSVWIRTKSMNG